MHFFFPGFIRCSRNSQRKMSTFHKILSSNSVPVNTTQKQVSSSKGDECKLECGIRRISLTVVLNSFETFSPSFHISELMRNF